MKKCHPGSRRHAMHMNTSPARRPVPPINQHSARTDYTPPLRSQPGFGGISGRLGSDLSLQENKRGAERNQQGFPFTLPWMSTFTETYLKDRLLFKKKSKHIF